MTEGLFNLIVHWQNKDCLGKRECKFNDSHIKAGEYHIVLKISIRLIGRNIIITKTFETYAQSSNDALTDNNGDVKRLGKIISDLETDFLKEYERRANNIR